MTNLLHGFVYLLNVVSLETSVTFDQIKFDPGAFIDRLISIHHDLRVVEEGILPIISCNKPKTLQFIKPLYFSQHAA